MTNAGEAKVKPHPRRVFLILELKLNKYDKQSEQNERFD